MVMYKGGMVVGKGMYWNPLDGQRVNVREDAKLPGDEGKSYLKMSPASLLAIAPLFGMMYTLFLPLYGIGVLIISCVVSLISTTARVATTGVWVCCRIAGRSVFSTWKPSLASAKYVSLAKKASRKACAAPRALPDCRLLLVDDEMAFVDTLAQRLKLRGLRPNVVYDGEQAVALVNNEEPDVMVLDLRMPGMDGIEVLRQVKQEHPKVQVIILSGKATENDREKATQLGSFDFLKKPIDIDTLLGKIKEACWGRIENPAHAYATR